MDEQTRQPDVDRDLKKLRRREKEIDERAVAIGSSVVFGYWILKTIFVKIPMMFWYGMHSDEYWTYIICSNVGWVVVWVSALAVIARAAQRTSRLRREFRERLKAQKSAVSEAESADGPDVTQDA